MTGLAQRSTELRRAIVISALGVDDPLAVKFLSAFREELVLAGWKQGINLQIEWQVTGGSADEARRLAAAVSPSETDLIVTHGGTVTTAVLARAWPVPVIFMAEADPITAGFVASLARPGGLATGFVELESSQAGKWVALLKEISPNVSRVAVLGANNPLTRQMQPSVAAALAANGLGALSETIDPKDTIEAAVERLVASGADGAVVLPNSFAAINREGLAVAMLKHRLPAIYANALYARSGGLMSYGADRIDAFRRAGRYADRVLRGVSPKDLPVQTPSKLELVINLRTASAMGISVPHTLLAMASELLD